MDTKALVNYHITSDDVQSFQFDVGGVEGKLISPELSEKEVKVIDLKSAASDLSFEKDGLLLLHSQSSISSFVGQRWRETYEVEIANLLKSSIGAKEILVFDHTVRIDDSGAIRKPARNVHNDYSEKAAYARLDDLVDAERSAEFKRGEFGFVNVWRPIKETINTSPLGFIKPSSIAKHDWIDIELIYPDRKGQILGVLNNPNHEWFYFSQMTPEEVVVFNIFNNRGKPHLAHSALDIIDESKKKSPRKSIETRTLVRYA